MGVDQANALPYYDDPGVSSLDSHKSVPARPHVSINLNNIQPDLEEHVSHDAWAQEAHQRLAQSVIDMTPGDSTGFSQIPTTFDSANGTANGATESALTAEMAAQGKVSRQKVSRACDACRRKKVASNINCGGNWLSRADSM